jgi:hypothetical protein
MRMGRSLLWISDGVGRGSSPLMTQQIGRLLATKCLMLDILVYLKRNLDATARKVVRGS